MKSIKIQFTFLLSLLFAFNLFATPPNPSIRSTVNANGTPWIYDFDINNIPAGVTSAFWILGDGHFRSDLNFNNQELIAGNNNNVQAFLLKPYIIAPPIKLTCGNCANNNSNTIQSSNVPVAMGPNEYLKIGTSWNPVPGGKHYTILTFENKGLIADGKVKVEFLNNISDIQVNQLENNSNWYSNLSIIGNVLEFEFSNLAPGEQRHLLVETKVEQFTSGNAISYIAEIGKKNKEIGFEYNSSLDIRKYPHDPNHKTVSEDRICAINNESITLEYRIDFQNIGAYYASDVIIIDALPPFLDYSSFRMISASDPCQAIISGNVIEFVFNQIKLPGLVQNTPTIPHPNETKGYVIFQIETDKCLDEGDIDNQADVFFDNLPAITTTVANTQIVYNEYCYFNNISCDPVNDDRDDRDEQDDGEPGMHRLKNPNEKIDEKKLYPNPVQDVFFLDFNIEEEKELPSKLIVYNVHGKIIADLSNKLSTQKGKQHLAISTSDWPSGIYFVKLESTKETDSWKITKIQR